MKRIFALLLAMALVTACASAMAAQYYSTPTEGTYVYEINEDGETVRIFSYYVGTDKEITIPEMIGDKKVTSIDSLAFQGVSLTSVTIPGSVESIGNRAFSGCRGLTSVTFAGDTPPSFGSTNTFLYCPLEEIRVPEGSVEAYKSALKENYCGSGNDVRCSDLVPTDELPADELLAADLPRTGDHSRLALWLCLLAMAAAGMAAMRKRAA